MTTPARVLASVVAAVEAEGRRLRAEFYAPQGPRGRRGSCPLDREIEERLQQALQALIPARFCGEECGITEGTREGWVWLVDPHDGTFEYTAGRRGSAISVALLNQGKPVLGVVHAPDAPDRGADTIAWAEGAALTRNGRPVSADLSRGALEPGALVWATASAALKPETWSRAVAPARYVAHPSIAYRLARVAAGDGVATVSIHDVNEYDIAAGMALIAAAGGTTLDAAGARVTLAGNSERRVAGCFAGAPQAAAQLARYDWKLLDAEPRREPRVALGFPRKDDHRLARAQGVLLGQVIGDSLGSLVELKPAAEIAQHYPQGVRELADGGIYHTIAGQPTDDSELALTLARAVIQHKGYDAAKVLDAYRAWLTSRPVDVGMTTEKGLLGLVTSESESNGSLMRCSPIGVWAAGDPALAARTARDDSALTHPNPICLEACAAYCAAIAAGVAGASAAEMVEVAAAQSKGPAHEAVKRGAKGVAPADFFTHQGWVLLALQNAFYCLQSHEFEDALVQTVGRGGDTDTNAAIAGALLGACHGRDAIPARWITPVLACRPLAEAGATRARPMEYWPDDLLELAEALLNRGQAPVS
ncbi:MAG TPA: inositol monophosphatase family protein [Burkholderiales bacterium]|nr:inositol monophosphatase family protein [Burkholderiales bacterium]